MRANVQVRLEGKSDLQIVQAVAGGNICAGSGISASQPVAMKKEDAMTEIKTRPCRNCRTNLARYGNAVCPKCQFKIKAELMQEEALKLWGLRQYMERGSFASALMTQSWTAANS